MPGMVMARDSATWSNVLYSSLQTITCHEPPVPVSGPLVRGSSTTADIRGPNDRSGRAACAQVAVQSRPQRLGRRRLHERGGFAGAGEALGHPRGVAVHVGLLGEPQLLVELLVQPREV